MSTPNENLGSFVELNVNNEIKKFDIFKNEGEKRIFVNANIGGKSYKISVYYSDIVPITEAEKILKEKLESIILVTKDVFKDPNITKLQITDKTITASTRNETQQVKYKATTELYNEVQSLRSSLENVSRTTTTVAPPTLDEFLHEIEFKTEAITGRCLSNISEMHNREIDHLSKVSDRYNKLEMKLTNFQNGRGDLNELPQLKANFETEMDELRLDFNVNIQRNFTRIQDTVQELTTDFNAVVDHREKLEIALKTANDTGTGTINELQAEIKKCEGTEHHLEKQIKAINCEMSKFHLSTHPASQYEQQCQAYASVVEKKLSLLEEKFELQKVDQGKLKIATPKGQNPDPKATSTLSNTQAKRYDAINKELDAAPKFSSTFKIQPPDLNRVSLMSTKEAKELNKVSKELQWGNSHLNNALANPANWTDIYSIQIKQSDGGRMYAFSTINQPIGELNHGGVTAGMRKTTTERPANMYKTTHYMVGSEEPRHVSYRGGQFPSVTAAKIAIRNIVENLANDETASAIHINSLLTPVTLGKPDRGLLKAHKANIKQALEELYNNENNGELKAKYKVLKDNFIFSNFGVNEGAVGEMKGMHAVGWHTSTFKYNNDAAKELRETLNTHLENMNVEEIPTDPAEMKKFIAKLNALPALTEVGLEMDEIWANNDFAKGKVGDNPFKLPAMWKVMDGLMGIASYLNCMSGKDRTSRTESSAQHIADEIQMNTAEHRAKLKATFEELKSNIPKENQGKIKAWEANKEILTAACFTEGDLVLLFELLITDGANIPEKEKRTIDLKSEIKKLIHQKVENAQVSFGIDKDSYSGTTTNETFMKGKKEGILTSSPLGTSMGIGTTGFSTHTPLRESHIGDIKLMPTSAYAEKSRGSVPTTKKDLAELKKRHREAYNLRLSQTNNGSLEITQTNTGLPGFKVKGGKPLQKFSSGFDRDYVNYKIGQAKLGQAKLGQAKLGSMNEASLKELFSDLTGLNELSPSVRLKYEKQMAEAVNKNGNFEATLNEIYSKIEKDKFETLYPKGSVNF